MMLQYDFDESIGYWVAATSHAMRRALDTELSKEDITFRQWQVLAWISLCGEPCQVELAECLGIEAPTLAGILARMERDGWLQRRSCPSDRRKKRIRVTAKAEAVWARMVECCGRVRNKATEGLSPAELSAFRQACEKIRKNLDVSASGRTLDAAVETPDILNVTQ
jgi:MarR family transcriptional regulator for hemolysin